MFIRRTFGAALMLALAILSVRAFPPQTVDIDGTPKVTVKELKAKLDAREKVVVVDVRKYANTTIKGALHIPMDEFEKRINELPKDKLIVTLCACIGEGTSGRAVKILQSKGYVKVAALKGGYNEWENSRFPTESIPETK